MAWFIARDAAYFALISHSQAEAGAGVAAVTSLMPPAVKQMEWGWLWCASVYPGHLEAAGLPAFLIKSFGRDGN